MDFIGTIKVINNTIQITDTFKKRDFVISDEQSQYPQHVLFELTQDKCDLLNNYQIGQEVKVYFNLRGREWTDKEGKVRYFNSLNAWKLEATGNSAPAPASREEQPYSTKQENDDLPF